MRKGLLLGSLLAFLWGAIGHAAARGGMPDPLTETGRRIESIYFQIFVAGTLVFLLVFGLLVFVLVRYRERGGKGRATFEAERHSLAAELTWTIIPLLIVGWVGAIAYQGLLELDEPGDEVDYVITITGSQWNWFADYGGGVGLFADPDSLGNVADDKVFMVPADQRILFNVTAADVIHSFYIRDADYGAVGMVDANPNGPNRFNRLSAVFPEGEYFVQCKEMCLNPGHAYMRARIKAVPQAEFDAWYKRLEVESQCPHKPLFQHLRLDVRDGDLAAGAGGPVQAVKDSCIIWNVANNATASATLTLGDQTFTIEAGTTEFWVADLRQAGDLTLASDRGGNVTVQVVEAEVLDVRLREFAIEPTQIRVEAGKTYLFRIENTGAAPHNFFVGHGDDAVAMSATVPGGSSTSLLWTPGEGGDYDTWCAVAGHRDAGMEGHLEVA